MSDELKFTKEQHAELLKMIEEHKRWVWLWATVGVWTKWIGMVLAALVAFKVLSKDWLGK